MAEMKSLAKDTVIYGGSTILVRMMSYLLTSLFTYTITKADFGLMTSLYAYTALALVVLTFGMETGFFRFANQKDKYNPQTVYSTSLIAVGTVVLLFTGFVFLFLEPITGLLWKNEIPQEYVLYVVLFLALDAFCAIPFAHLRYSKRPIRFALLKVIFVVVYSILCLFFLLLCPYLYKNYSSWVDWFYKPDFKLGYILISNLIATSIQTGFLLPELTGFRYRFDRKLLKKMLSYSLPLLLLGIAGMSNQIMDKLIFPFLYPEGGQAFDELGVYSACFKVALIMMIFTQAFRYAYEPFFFSKSSDKNNKETYIQAMKYFVIFGLLIFIGVMFYLDIIKYFISPDFFGALGVVPIIMMGELFFGIYFNLSVWYKLTDKTYWGAAFSSIGCILIIAINIVFIPIYGYMACAWAAFAGNLVIMLLSYFIGQKQYKINYDLKSVFLYFGLALSLFFIGNFVQIDNLALRLLFRTFLLAIFVAVMIKRDIHLSELPYIGKRFKTTKK